MEKYRVTLTTEERVGLERLVSTGRAAARKLCHARILLLADETLAVCRPGYPLKAGQSDPESAGVLAGPQGIDASQQSP